MVESSERDYTMVENGGEFVMNYTSVENGGEHHAKPKIRKYWRYITVGTKYRCVVNRTVKGN